MKDFITFRKMITPIIIQIMFWVGFAGCLIFGIFSIATGFNSGAYEIIRGIFVILFGPLAIRLWCEIMTVVFTINDTLTDIKNILGKKKLNHEEMGNQI